MSLRSRRLGGLLECRWNLQNGCGLPEFVFMQVLLTGQVLVHEVLPPGPGIVGPGGKAQVRQRRQVCKPAPDIVWRQAHGLGAEPDGFNMVIECLTTEANWAVGDRISLGASYGTANASVGMLIVQVDATNVALIIGSVGFFLGVNKTTRVLTNFTAANWKVEIDCFLFS